MKKKMLSLAASLAVVFFPPCLAFDGQEGDPNVTLLQAVDPAKYPGANAVVVYDSTDVDVEESGRSSVLMHRLTLILTKRGALDHRFLEYQYDPQSADVEVRFVRVYRKDGTVETLPPDRIADDPAPARAIYWGMRRKSVNVGRLEPGDAVETLVFRTGFMYALLGGGEDDRFVPPMRGHFYDIVEFWSSLPMREKVYRVAMPKDKPLQYEVYNGELGSSVHFHPSKTARIRVDINPGALQAEVPEDDLHPTSGMKTVAGKVVYTWWKRDIAPFREEPAMAAVSDVACKLLLSTAQDWYAKAAWFHAVNEDFKSFEVTPEIRKLVDSLLAGVTDELEKIAILNRWSAEEIRYSGISMGKGEGFTLHPGSMTFRDRCGVCKDKAGMTITLLRAAGFEAYPAMTMAGSRIDRIPADQFNHSVALVKRSNGHWMLLDPTWVPGVREFWSSAEQQQQYLPGIPGGADLMTTPVSPADNHFWKLTGESELSEDGTLEGTLLLEAEGQSDAMIRRAFTRSYRSSWGEYIPRLFYAFSPRVEILDQQIHDPEDLSRPMRVFVRYRIPGYALVDGKRMLFTPLAARNPLNDGILSPELSMDTALAVRRYGFRTRCSKATEFFERVTLPRGWSVAEMPGLPFVKSSSASFEASYTMEGGVLVL
ncbi:MAG: DUF3857 and transglutaminase domain-containing protein, partial [Bacteroidota bacterium]|nr:DUF3857 and transglutaminase domain-containing protein [Bacteroidota bacterium]